MDEFEYDSDEEDETPYIRWEQGYWIRSNGSKLLENLDADPRCIKIKKNGPGSEIDSLEIRYPDLNQTIKKTDLDLDSKKYPYSDFF